MGENDEYNDDDDDDFGGDEDNVVDDTDIDNMMFFFNISLQQRYVVSQISGIEPQYVGIKPNVSFLHKSVLLRIANILAQIDLTENKRK